MKKKLFYWLVGDRTGRVVVSIWNWLWGLPVEMNSEISREVASDSLQSMQASVAKLTQSVATVVAAYQQAKAIYDAKQKEAQQTEQQARLAYTQGHAEAAQLAMGKVIQLETLLPQLQERVAAAEELMHQHQERLKQERQRLETYKVRMQNLESLAEVNRALAAIAKTSNDLQIGSARSQFERAESSVKRQHLQGRAYADLSVDPTEKLQVELTQLTLSDEIHCRLQQFETNPEEEHSNHG
jgi:phage shock protein A